MLVSQILEQFYKQHPTYRNIGYSLGNVQYSERLHPLFVFTQYIIDTMIPMMIVTYCHSYWLNVLPIFKTSRDLREVFWMKLSRDKC